MRRRPRKVQATEIAKSGAERLLDVRRTVAECVASIAIPKPVKRKRRIKRVVAVRI